MDTWGLAARYGAILRHYSCYMPPYSAISFRGRLDVRYPPPLILFCMQAKCQCDRGLYGKIAEKFSELFPLSPLTLDASAKFTQRELSGSFQRFSDFHLEICERQPPMHQKHPRIRVAQGRIIARRKERRPELRQRLDVDHRRDIDRKTWRAT